MKSVTILGATGSIGDSAFEVITKNPDAFQIDGVAGGTAMRAATAEATAVDGTAARTSAMRACAR